MDSTSNLCPTNQWVGVPKLLSSNIQTSTNRQKPRCLCNLVMHEITDAPRIFVVCGGGLVSPFVRSFCSAKGKCPEFFCRETRGGDGRDKTSIYHTQPYDVHSHMTSASSHGGREGKIKKAFSLLEKPFKGCGQEGVVDVIYASNCCHDPWLKISSRSRRMPPKEHFPRLCFMKHKQRERAASMRAHIHTLSISKVHKY